MKFLEGLKELFEELCNTENEGTLKGGFNINALNELVSSSDKRIIEKSYENVGKLEGMFTSPEHVIKIIPRKKQVEPTAIEYNNKETHNVKNKEDRENERY